VLTFYINIDVISRNHHSFIHSSIHSFVNIVISLCCVFVSFFRSINRCYVGVLGVLGTGMSECVSGEYGI